MHMANTRRDVTKAFNHKSLPPYDIITMVDVTGVFNHESLPPHDIIAMVDVSCLSIRQTKGISSWTGGLVVLKVR